MGWTLVVSEDERFQREAINRVAGTRPVVGATGDESARSLVRAINVDTVLVDAMDDVGRRFLSVLRSLPHASIPGVQVIAVGPQGAAPSFETTPSLASALGARETFAA